MHSDSTLCPISPDARKSFRPRTMDHCHDAMRQCFDALAPAREAGKGRAYHAMLLKLYRFHVPEGARVLELGCGNGGLLAGLKPSHGLGLDVSEGMIQEARRLHPDPALRFEVRAAEAVTAEDGPFDYIILSDLVGFLYDILAVLRAIKPLCHDRTRVILNFHSRLWQPALELLERLGKKQPQPVLNWVAPGDVRNLLELAGFDVISTDRRILFPGGVPVLKEICNRLLAPLPLVEHLCLANFVVARLPEPMPEDSGVSVICACRNEEGNIPDICRRFPAFAGPAELIFVEGNSKDRTYEACLQAKEDFPHLDIAVFRQPGKGKGDAVRTGFAQAKHPIVMILDADMTVPPEDLPGFVEALVNGRAEFVNGSRLVYPMEGKAMRFLNLLGNKFFSLAFSFLLNQPLKDTLCGTKVVRTADWNRILAGRGYFGDIDPFGDFDLLFGAAKLSLKIRDYPIRYRDRTYGDTNISRFRHGIMLLKMCAVAAWKLKLRG